MAMARLRRPPRRAGRSRISRRARSPARTTAGRRPIPRAAGPHTARCPEPRAVCVSRRAYGSKIRSRHSSGMPGPSSATPMRTPPSAIRQSSRIVVSGGAYFTAFSTRCSRIWRSRLGSVRAKSRMPSCSSRRWRASSGASSVGRLADDLADVGRDEVGGRAAGADGVVRLRVATWRGRFVNDLPAHSNAITSLAFSHRGGFFATSTSLDDTARVWELQTQRRRAVLRGQTGAVGQVAFSPDGHLVATARSRGRTARVWDSGTVPDLHVVARAAAPVRAASYAPDDGEVVTAGGGRQGARSHARRPAHARSAAPEPGPQRALRQRPHARLHRRRRSRTSRLEPGPRRPAPARCAARVNRPARDRRRREAAP